MVLSSNPNIKLYTLLNPKAKLSDLMNSKTKKALLEGWLLTNQVVDKVFTSNVEYLVDFAEFFPSISLNSQSIFIAPKTTLKLSDLVIESVMFKTDIQYLFFTNFKNIKKFNWSNDEFKKLEKLMWAHYNVSDIFTKTLLISNHPAFLTIVSEFHELGTLYNIIYLSDSQKQTLSEGSLSLVVRNLLKAIQQTHEETKVLMCIKPENVYLKNLHQIAISRYSSTQIKQKIKAIDGKIFDNFEYFPPEILLKLDNDKSVQLGLGIDYWQLGIFMLCN